MSDASETDESGASEGSADLGPSGLREMMSIPAHVAFFAGCVIAGATLSYFLIQGDLSIPRRIVGGALLGGFGWLLAMVHRII